MIVEELKPELRRKENESHAAWRARLRKVKGLGPRKKTSAKAQHWRDRPEQAAHATCLVCKNNRLACTCSGHMTPERMEAFTKSQKDAPEVKQSGWRKR